MEFQEQMEKVGSWLKDISASLGVKISLDSQGMCCFQVGDMVITLEVSQDFPLIEFYSPLVPLPQEQEESTLLMIRALELNAFQVQTRGGAIGIAPGGGLLIFCFSIPTIEMDSEKFSAVLGGFFETVTDLKALLVENKTVLDRKNTQPNKLSKAPWMKI